VIHPSPSRGRVRAGCDLQANQPPRTATWQRGVWAFAALAGTLVSTPSALWALDAERAIVNEIGNVRSGVALVEDDLRKARERERRFPLDRRFLEATIAYERGNLPTASVLFVDLVGDPQFQTSRDYGDALYMLGDALYRQRNYAGAKRYFERILGTPGGKWYQAALAQAVDIAVRLRRMDDVAALAKKLDLVPNGERKGELFYQFGRSYFIAKDYARARPFLESVGADEPRWAAARFYLGALLVAQNKQTEAASEFKRVADAAKAAASDPKRKLDATVVDYVHLALGRLLLNQKKFEEAAQYYGLIDRNSAVFEEALFELAATYVAANQPKRALEVLDILLLTVSDDNVAVQAAVLRGRINMLDKQYDKADAAYAEVVDRYSAIEGELRAFASSDKNLEQFFQWLLARGSEDYTVVRPVSERVAKYVERDEDMQRVVSLFDDMGAARADVKESVKLAATIDAALRESSRLDMFPELKDAWMRLTHSQNRCVDIGKRIVDTLRGLALNNLRPEERSQAEALMAQRQQLETAFAKIPADAGAYVKRQSRVANDFTNLAGEVGVLKAQLSTVKEQLLSVEKMLNERVFGGEGVTLTKDTEGKVRQALVEEKDELRRLYRELEDLVQSVEVTAQSVGAGDKVSKDENTIRMSLLNAQRAEIELYAAALERGAGSGDAVGLRNARSAVDKLMGDIATVLGMVQDRAGERLVGLKKTLAQEQRNISEYQASVRNYEDDSRTLARQVGYTLVRTAQNRLSEIILEADLGMVDVAWQRKQDRATSMRELQDEMSKRVKSLGDVLENLSSDGTEEE
jgi:tetratricopeptide (TPR) repeat protein